MKAFDKLLHWIRFQSISQVEQEKAPQGDGMIDFQLRIDQRAIINYFAILSRSSFCFYEENFDKFSCHQLAKRETRDKSFEKVLPSERNDSH